MQYFSRRTWLGAILFLILVGEPTVGMWSGLFSPRGVVIFVGLYVTLFLLYEALVVKYRLTNIRLIALTFGIYSVLVTGLLHGELGDFADPKRTVITALIRIQCCFYPIFAYHLLNKATKRTSTLSVRAALALFLGYFLLLTPTRVIGFTTMAYTVVKYPIVSGLFLVAGTWAVFWALKTTGKRSAPFVSPAFTKWCWLFLALGCIPSLPTLLILLVSMPLVALYYCRKPEFRNSVV